MRHGQQPVEEAVVALVLKFKPVPEFGPGGL